MIPTSRHVEYALGYISLGLLTEASDELDAVSLDDRCTPPVLGARLDLHMAAKQWEAVVGLASRLTEIDPGTLQGWILWAYALREMNLVEAARGVLLRAEPLHGAKHAIVHYNLACYHCLLGARKTAMTCLAKACRMDANFKTTALADPDLKSMKDEIASMK